MEQQRNLGHEYNPLRSRMAELSQHISQNENYTKRKVACNQYEKDLVKQMPWKKKSFAADNSWIVEHYNEAKQYIDGVRNANGKIPLATWQKKYSELSKKIEELDGRYQILKTKVAQANRFRVRVYDVLRKEKQKTQPMKKRSQDMEL
jgi:23S rRNA A1618 N6-methylase RlmF